MKGSSAELLLYGATVISWKAGDSRDPLEPRERLFLSSKAVLDGSKPIRGGIPVVFPCFGAPTHPEHNLLGQHGFARSETWAWGGIVMDNDAGVSVRLSQGFSIALLSRELIPVNGSTALEPTPKIAAVYQKLFRLEFVATLSEHQLSTDLHVKNTSSEVLEFQALFHNYVRASAHEVLIRHLQNLEYFDKTDSSFQGLKTETRAEVDVRRYTDSVYENAPQKYEITWPAGGLAVKSTRLKDVVVWNPQADAGSKIGDMEEGGWEHFVCLEPGYVRGFVSTQPGETWIGQQVLETV
ncbi:hypothetical protein D9757_002932 [Collybiopsis confluens]|uniref:Glucose-6-phosphate 1-epimerase n=1 Tax=Collybiopsis confluens TaxID=2823264 RepID=A0A8H5HVC5_9AGAR|nr:hypothetical protein D9757_002932 [Collybiopsis confluens]